MPSKARVVVVGRGSPERGGIPTFMDMMSRERERLGRPVTVVNLAPERPTRGGRARVDNVLRTARDARRVAGTVRSGDVLHLHSALAPTVTCIRAGILIRVARLRGAEAVVHAHGGLLAHAGSGRVSRWLTRRSLAPAAALAAVSEDVERALRSAGLPRHRVHRIANGVSCATFRPAPQPHTPPRVLFVGGLTERKGVLDLLHASTQLIREGVEHELVLVGGRPDEGAEAQPESLREPPPHVRMVGEFSPEDMPQAYTGADIFCLPSWWEAMPLSVLEAQACGLPVVVTDVGEVTRMVKDGETGLVVGARDRPALADALRLLITDPGRRRAMGDRAREVAVAEFDEHETLAALRELFDRVDRADEIRRDAS